MTMCGRLLATTILILTLAVADAETGSVRASEAERSQTTHAIHEALSGKKLVLYNCNEKILSKASCRRLMHDFVALTDINLISPDWVAGGPNDERFNKAFGQCINGTADSIYEMDFQQASGGTASGPFDVYHLQSGSGSTARHRDVVRLFGYHPEDPTVSYDWSRYVMFDLTNCSKQSVAFFYHRGASPQTPTESLDGIVRLRGHRYVFAVDQISPDAPQYEVYLVDLDRAQFGHDYESIVVFFVSE